MTSKYQGVPRRECIEEELLRVARAQFGVFRRDQARACGFSQGVIDYRVAGGRWERLYPAVYRIAGAEGSRFQALLSACFAWGEGSVIALSAGASLWELAGFPDGPIELIVPRTRERDLDHIVHRPVTPLQPFEITKIQGIPVTGIARTLVDVAGDHDRDRIEEALDDAVRRKLISPRGLDWYVTRTTSRGRAGVRILRELLDARSGKDAVPESVFETRLLRLFRRARLPCPEIQYEIRTSGGRIVRVDFAYPAARLAIEADGCRWLSGRARWEQDLDRRNALTELGWCVVHVTWTDVTSRPGVVAARIRSLLSNRKRDP